MMRTGLALLALIAISCANSALSPVERALQSVVHIVGIPAGRPVVANTDGVQVWWEMQEGEIATYGCSAFSIDVRKFVTAAHCIGESMKVDGHPAFVIAQDKQLDLALLVADYVRPALMVRNTPLQREEHTIGLGYGFSWLYPTITHHQVMILDFSPWPEVMPGVWYSGAFIGGMSGGPVIDGDGVVVGVVQRGSDVVGYGVNAATLLAFLAAQVV